jgi:hypothetical protein
MQELVEQVNTERMSAHYRLGPKSTIIVKKRESQELGSILQSLKFETSAI